MAGTNETPNPAATSETAVTKIDYLSCEMVGWNPSSETKCEYHIHQIWTWAACEDYHQPIRTMSASAIEACFDSGSLTLMAITNGSA